MFKWFKKKKKVTEDNERFTTMSTEDILLGIQVIQKRNPKNNKHYATFLNTYITKKTCRQLGRKKISVEVLDDNGIPGFKVSW